MDADWHDKSILILGCGNPLLEDDGFGTAVARRLLQGYTIPPDVAVLDVETSVRQVLFDVTLAENKPSKIVIVDAMDTGREPGELFNVDIDSIPNVKLDDFSMHQIPTSNLLRELKELAGIEITVLACQPLRATGVVKPGLSRPVQAAVEKAADLLACDYLK
jgi:coenzyme F420 hydrogenase subunit delta